MLRSRSVHALLAILWVALPLVPTAHLAAGDGSVCAHDECQVPTAGSLEASPVTRAGAHDHERCVLCAVGSQSTLQGPSPASPTADRLVVGSAGAPASRALSRLERALHPIRGPPLLGR